LIIGRASKKSVPDIDLSPFGGSKAGVSRKHSRLLCRQGDWFVEDLGSTNGTFINGEKLAPNQQVPVTHNDTIRCGQIELHFAID
jgi:pSer/pThr/pTyr-binding forkhead associated (FHA) protein